MKISPKYIFKAKVTNIVDGDTIDVEIDVGFRIKMEQRLRFNKINTAELFSKDPEQRILAQKAKEFVKEKLLNKDVIIITSKSDAFGRYLATIFYVENGMQICINDQLLELNLAVLYK